MLPNGDKPSKFEYYWNKIINNNNFFFTLTFSFGSLQHKCKSKISKFLHYNKDLLLKFLSSGSGMYDILCFGGDGHIL